MKWRNTFWACICIATGVGLFAIPTRAGTVTTFTDQPSSMQISAESNHKFSFTTTSAIVEGSILSITFPAEFTLSTLLENDVDIADDGVDLSTSTDCSGSDQASVSISGQSIYITICAGDGGAIDDGSVVVVEIGTNASAFGSGTHRITNPPSVGSYFLILSETGGNSGSVILTTTTTGGTSVSATVPDPSVPSDGQDPGESCDSDYGDVCTSAENSCGMTTSGRITCGGSCSATMPSEDECFVVCDASYGDACVSASNSCGMTNAGTIACDGSCSAEVPEENECAEPCDASYGDACVSASNSCGMTNAGTVACDGSCSAEVPSSDACISAPVCSLRFGNACTSSSNSCGMTNGGIIGCDGSCSAERPSETSCTSSACAEAYGDECVSSANSCGIVNTGSVSCSGACSAEMPSEQYCSQSAICDVNAGDVCSSLTNSCGFTNAGVIGCDGSCSAETPSEDLCVTAACVQHEGDACTSLANSCGQVNQGRVTCDGSCSANSPAEKYCVIIESEKPATIAVGTLADAVESFRANPRTQTVSTIATPIAVLSAVSTAATLATSLNVLNYLHFLFTSPLILIHKRKRKPFGIVYHAVTKVPIDLAVVRLYSAETHRLVKSVVTNGEGKYFFVVDPGQYQLTVTKDGFTFPSTYLQNIKDDGVFLDVYTGQNIEVTAADAVIAANIPLDVPDRQRAVTPRSVLLKKIVRRLQWSIAFSGSGLSCFVYFVTPSWLTASLAVGQVCIFLLFIRLARAKKPKGWGVVYDAHTRRPVGKAIVRLFEPKYNKLVETTITDSLGRYSFFVGANEYVIRTSKDGYAEHTANAIDCRQYVEPAPLAVDVPLTPEKRV